jgi:hypothetical protein
VTPSGACRNTDLGVKITAPIVCASWSHRGSFPQSLLDILMASRASIASTIVGNVLNFIGGSSVDGVER